MVDVLLLSLQEKEALQIPCEYRKGSSDGINCGAQLIYLDVDV